MTFVPVPNAGPRLAGLLAGDYDVIENPAARDVSRIKDDKRFGHVITPSTRVIYFQLDVEREPSPFVKAENGKNPLKDPRVRKAMSLAIDRDAIIKRIMDGAAEPAYQFLPNGMFGALANPPKLAYDPAAAKKLLAEAGYPNGFQITLSTTNDRYINDSQITQAVAQYLTQVGIRSEVDAMARAIYFPRRAKKEFSVALGGWGSTSGEASSFLQSVASDPGRGEDYRRLELWRLQRSGVRQADPRSHRHPRRRQALRACSSRPERRHFEGGAFIPLHFESTIWAYKANLTYTGRADQFTMAMQVKPTK